tara:strand:+ start:286 stop:534 length:249 start_codon:yes stop_codon:yes gene_type:complete
VHDTSTPSPSVRGATVLVLFVLVLFVLDADADMAFFLVRVLETDTAVVDTAVVDTDTALGFFVVVLFASHGKKEANPAIVLG